MYMQIKKCKNNTKKIEKIRKGNKSKMNNNNFRLHADIGCQYL